MKSNLDRGLSRRLRQQINLYIFLYKKDRKIEKQFPSKLNNNRQLSLNILLLDRIFVSL